MRELKECREEIFRRSENRIKERGQRCRRTFVYCSSFCLLFVVWLASTLMTIRLANESYVGNDTAQGKIDSYASIWVQVEIQQNKQETGYHHIITETKNVAFVYDMIQTLYDSNMLAGSGDEDVLEGNSTDKTTSEVKQEYDFLITFTARDGETFSFELDDNCLFDSSGNREICLDEKQLIELKTALGLK